MARPKAKQLTERELEIMHVFWPPHEEKQTASRHVELTACWQSVWATMQHNQCVALAGGVGDSFFGDRRHRDFPAKLCIK